MLWDSPLKTECLTRERGEASSRQCLSVGRPSTCLPRWSPSKATTCSATGGPLASSCTNWQLAVHRSAAQTTRTEWQTIFGLETFCTRTTLASNSKTCSINWRISCQRNDLVYRVLIRSKHILSSRVSRIGPLCKTRGSSHRLYRLYERPNVSLNSVLV